MFFTHRTQTLGVVNGGVSMRCFPCKTSDLPPLHLQHKTSHSSDTAAQQPQLG